jgi:hypothetical protein
MQMTDAESNKILDERFLYLVTPKQSGDYSIWFDADADAACIKCGHAQMHIPSDQISAITTIFQNISTTLFLVGITD